MLLKNVNNIYFCSGRSIKWGISVKANISARENIIPALEDEDANARWYAVTILLVQKPLSAREALEKVQDDPDFETCFYAKQAIKLIGEKYSQ
jgi:hypothetical protein